MCPYPCEEKEHRDLAIATRRSIVPGTRVTNSIMRHEKVVSARQLYPELQYSAKDDTFDTVFASRGYIKERRRAPRPYIKAGFQKSKDTCGNLISSVFNLKQQPEASA